MTNSNIFFTMQLEWCIIILISVEIAFSILHYLEKWRDKHEEEVNQAIETERLKAMDEELIETDGGDDWNVSSDWLRIPFSPTGTTLIKR